MPRSQSGNGGAGKKGRKSDKWDVSTTPCGHIFHTGCILNMITAGECPYCRQETSFTRIFPLRFTIKVVGIPLVANKSSSVIILYIGRSFNDSSFGI